MVNTFLFGGIFFKGLFWRQYGQLRSSALFFAGLTETQVTRLLFRNQRPALETKSLSQTLFDVLRPNTTTWSLSKANNWADGLPSPGSWKPFLTADEGGGGGGGGAAEPGRSGGSGGRDPPLWLSSPARDGSWGVAGKDLEVLPFLLMGGGGGRGPGARQEANTQMPFAPGLILPW